ncbi:Holliday junction resolvase RuvX [Nakamurella sp. A5-74]|uniref:Putative pre-16S rRNA nuclease n=1 Tax=Nakamurella sp. A5-74 TaxID=3158264 RepID=A0AAU8DLA6_9ACTN
MSGVRLGIDVGSVRVGVARSDPGGILATPVATVRRDPSGADLAELVSMIEEFEVVEVVVGLPRTLRGTDGPAVAAARDYAAALTDLLANAERQIPIVFIDERLTSVSANRMLADRGIDSRARREIVDQAAAVGILQTRLDGLRR